MAIITDEQLSNELPTGYTDAQVTSAVNESSRLVNTWCINYEEWPDESETVDAPDEIQRACIEIAKALFFLAIGAEDRDGNEADKHGDSLKYYEGYLKTIEINPEILSVDISLDSNGVQLIARNQHILIYHTKCRVESAETPAAIWNQGWHWDIRKGVSTDDEQLDGWYFDAETYEDTIEGVLYYARSWRSDGLDYQKYWRPELSQGTSV